MKKFTDLTKLNRPKRIFEQEISLNQETPQVQVQVQPAVQTQAQNIPTKKEEQPTQGQKEVKGDVAKFVSKLLEAREMAQVYHWTVKGDMGSHAAHTALEEFYNSIIGLIDDIVEVYQGQYDLIEGYDIIDTKPTQTKDKVEYFKEIADFIKENRNTALSAEDTHIQNIVDEVVALTYKLLYKLRFNK